MLEQKQKMSSMADFVIALRYTIKILSYSLLKYLSDIKHQRFSEHFMQFYLKVVLTNIAALMSNIIQRVRVQCSACGWKGAIFFPCINYLHCRYIRPAAVCPKCESLERHRRMAEFLRTHPLVNLDLHILSVAPEPCINYLLQGKTKYLITVDIQSAKVMALNDLHYLGFRNDTFGLILCCDVLEHVRDDRQCLRELWRVLQPGGLALLHVPYDPDSPATIEFGEARPDLNMHTRCYGADYFARLTEVGFSVLLEGKGVGAVTKQL